MTNLAPFSQQIQCPALILPSKDDDKVMEGIQEALDASPVGPKSAIHKFSTMHHGWVWICESLQHHHRIVFVMTLLRSVEKDTNVICIHTQTMARADWSVPEQAECATKALNLFVDFLKKNMDVPSCCA